MRRPLLALPLVLCVALAAWPAPARAQRPAPKMLSQKPGYREARKLFPADERGFSAVDLQALLLTVAGEASDDPREQCVLARSVILRSKDGSFGCRGAEHPLLCVVSTPGQYAGYRPDKAPGERAAGAAQAVRAALEGDCASRPFRYFCAGPVDDELKACGAEQIGASVFLERESCRQCRSGGPARARRSPPGSA